MDERLTHFCQPRASPSKVISCVQAVAAIASARSPVWQAHRFIRWVHTTSATEQKLTVVKSHSKYVFSSLPTSSLISFFNWKESVTMITWIPHVLLFFQVEKWSFLFSYLYTCVNSSWDVQASSYACSCDWRLSFLTITLPETIW